MVKKNRKGAIAKERRTRVLARLAKQTSRLRCSNELVVMLLEELNNSSELDELEQLVGDFSTLPRRRFAQTLALAVALRYSWRQDQLTRIARRIGALASRTQVAGRRRIRSY